MQGVSEKISSAFCKQGINTYDVPFNTLQSQLVHPKDLLPKKCGVIYKLECADCKKIYIGETVQPFNIRLKEHSICNTTRLTLNTIGEHLRDTGHKLEESKAAVIAREENNFRRRNLRGLGNSVPVPDTQSRLCI